ncbi:hypothetical protein Scep_003462 [Stephania cephalantha]|uniref:Uncharacterized protein n=1 Tax=Stephania cephalantha TaxID=152367 RepID=A0AAP0KS17_9MAGN
MVFPPRGADQRQIKLCRALLLVPANPFHPKRQDLRRRTVAEYPPPPPSPSSSTAIVDVDRDSPAQSFIRDRESPRASPDQAASARCALRGLLLGARRCSSPPPALFRTAAAPLFRTRRRASCVRVIRPLRGPCVCGDAVAPRSSAAIAASDRSTAPPLVASAILRRRWLRDHRHGQK